MEYKLIKKSLYQEFKDIESLIYGYKLTISKSKAKNITIHNQQFIDRLVYLDYGLKLNNLIEKIVMFLNNEENDEESSSLLLDELAHHRLILREKYELYLSKEANNIYIKNIRFLANELKRLRFSYNKSEILKKPISK